MAEFWLDTDSLITPSRGPYTFDILPPFWDFLEQKGEEGLVASSELVLVELMEGDDPLKEWAKEQGVTLFHAPTQAVQERLSEIAERVTHNSRFRPHHVAHFLEGADPWVIAHAKASGGRVVTFETSDPHSQRPKIPDVAREFGVECLTLYQMLAELGFQIPRVSRQ